MEEKVRGYTKRLHGRLVHVSSYFRRDHNKITPYDREVDTYNIHKAQHARRRK
jgi:hypothetical protein